MTFGYNKPMNSFVNPDIPVSNTGIGKITVNKNVEREMFEENIKASEEQPFYSPIDKLYQSYGDVSSFQFGATPTPYIAGPEAYETRARAQSGAKLAGNAAAQFFLGELIGGTIQGIGTLIAPNKWIDRMSNSADAFEGTLVEKLGETIQNYTREQFPIYQTSAAQKGVALTDATWYASMAPSVASALSMMIPARMASVLPVKLARQIANTSAVGRDIRAIRKAEYWTNVASSAFAGRMIDSTRESLGRYSQYYDENISQGMSDEEAKTVAADAAARGFRLSHANIVFDLVEWGIILRTSNYLKGDVNSKIKNLLFKDPKYTKLAGVGEEAITKEIGKVSKIKGLAKDMLFTGAVEGVDEMSMDTFQQEGKYQSDLKRGLVAKTTFEERIAEQIGDRKSWDSFIGGAIGGLLMMPLGSMIQRTTNKGYIEEINKQANLIMSRAEKANIHIESISKHLDNNDREKAQFEKDQMILDLINQSAANNTLEYDMDMLDNISLLSPEKLKAEGLNPDILEYINDIKENSKDIKRVFDNEMNIIRLKDSEGNIDDSNTYINTKIAAAKAGKVLFNRRIKENIKTLDVSEFEGNDLVYAYINTLIDNYNEKDNLNNSLQYYNKNILDLEEKIQELSNELPSIKDPAFRMVHQGILKSAKDQKDFMSKAIKDIESKINNIDEIQKLRLDIYKSLDTISKEKADNYFKDLKPESYRNRVDVYKDVVQEIDNNLDFWNTLEGKQSLKHEYDSILKITEDSTKKEIQDKVDKANTKAEVEAIKKEYADKNIDKSIYEPIIKSKLSKISAKETVTTQSARVEEAITTIETSGGVPVTDGRRGSLVSEPEIIIEEPVEFTSTDFTKLNNTSSKAATELLIAKQTDVNVGEFLIDSNYSRVAHSIKILDIILKTKEGREAFRKSGVVKGKVNVLDIFADLDAFNDINVSDNGNAGLILESIFNAASSIIDATDSNGYQFSIMNGVEVITPIGNTSFVKNDALSLASLSDHSLNDLVKDTISNYINSLETTSISFAGSLDTDLYSETTVVNKPVDSIIALNVGNEQTFKEITANLKSGIDHISDLLKNKSIRLGHSAKAINFDDVIKYLRDKDETNEIVNNNWFNTLQALKQSKAYIEYTIKLKESLNPKDQKSKDLINADIKRLKDLNDKIDIKGIDFAGQKGQDYVNAYLNKHPREVQTITRKAGTRAVLNIYDERTGKRIEFEDDLRDVNGNNIWKGLELIKEGTNVTFAIDDTISYKGKSLDQDWQTRPIKVNVKDKDGNDVTVLFVRELDYVDSGIQYGYKNSKGEFEFRGITSALDKRDYAIIALTFDSIRDFYVNYHNSKGNFKTSEKESFEKEYIKAFSTIKDTKELNDIFLKIINNNISNTDDLIEELLPENIISIVNPLFYKIRLEDAHDYSPSFELIANKLKARDDVYRSDFDSNKLMRKSISDGTLIDSTILSVTTPSVLINERKFKDGVELPRLTLDRTVKEVDLKDGLGKRIVNVMYNESSKSFIDMHTGNAILDTRFDYSNAVYKHIARSVKSSNMYTLLEAPGGKLIAFPVQTNTVGLSYKNEEFRNKAINFITSKLIAAERASTSTQIKSTISEIGHITIFDGTRSLNLGDQHYLSTHVIEEEFIDKYGNKREPSTFLRIKTLQNSTKDGHKTNVFYQIENEGRKGIISIYKSTYWKDIVNRNKGALIKDDNNNVITFDINTKEGEEKLTAYLNENVTPYMQRQVHVDMSKGKFSYEKENIGKEGIEKVTDPITDITYNSPQDYYIKTGALFSDLGSIKDSNGDIITNFNITGRFPMAVHLAEGKKKRIAKNVEGFEGLLEEGILNENDPYVEFIRTIAKSTGIKPNIEITGTTKKGVSASMQPIGKRWLLKVYNEYFDGIISDNHYTPTSLLIAHEYLHIGLSKSYLSKKGESQEDIEKRNDRISKHNREITNWVNEVETYWNSIENKTDFIRKSFPSVEMSDYNAERNVRAFEGYLKKSKEDIINKTGVGGTIQEPITYAFTTPIIAVVLNNMSTGESLEIKNKTAWDRLRNLFFKILSRIFKTELNDKGFLLKLNHTLNIIYSDTVKVGTDKARSLAEQKKEVGVEEVEISETPIITEDDEIKVEDSLKDTIDYMEENGFESIDEEMGAGTLDNIIDFNITSESKSINSLTGYIMNPNDQLFDSQNKPIC